MSDLPKPPLSQAIEALGRFFEVFEKGGILQAIRQKELFPESRPKPPSTPKITTESIMTDFLYDSSLGGIRFSRLLEGIETAVKDRKDFAEATAAADMAKTFCVTFDPAAAGALKPMFNGNGSPSKIIAKQGFEVDAPDGLPEWKLTDSINDQISRSTGMPIATEINTEYKKPTTAQPNLIYNQILQRGISPAIRDVGALTVFMNCMPTLEVSRAVPFIDVTLFEDFSTIGDTADGRRLQGLSLGKFLMGQVKDSEFDPKIWEANPVDNDGMIALLNAKADPTKTTAEKRGEKGVVQPNTAGMEIFTAPQTLVPANEMFSEDNEIQLTDKVPYRERAAPVLDRFRPFLSLLSLEITSAPSVQTFVYTQATLELVCHDRSRLAEVSGFVSPSFLGNEHLLIEYGWGHPDFQVHGNAIFDSSAEGKGNAFGAFIGSLRSREKYQIVNTSFNFDDVGQVTLSVKVSMMGNHDVANKGITQFGSKEDHQLIRRLTKKIGKAYSKLNEVATRASDNNPYDFLESSSTVDGALSLDKDSKKAIRAFLKQNRNAPPTSGLKEVADALSELYGADGSGEDSKLRRGHRKTKGGNAVAKYRQSASSFISRELDGLSDNSFSDPWFRDNPHGPGACNRKTQAAKFTRGYVSLGKLFANLVFVPLLDTGKFHEIQVSWGMFNKDAGAMYDWNIAQFPIDLHDLKVVMREHLKTNHQMTVANFVSFINKYFMEDHGNQAFGMREIYSTRSREDRTQRKAKTNAMRKKPSLLSDKTNSILKKIYASATTKKEAHFAPPKLGIILEAVPEIVDPTDDPNSGPTGVERTILRVHIYDNVCQTYPYYSSILNESSNESLKLLRDAADNGENGSDKAWSDVHDRAMELGIVVDVDLAKETVGKTNVKGIPLSCYRVKGGFQAIKEFVMVGVPSIRYGQEASGILSADVSSESDGLMSRIMMDRMGKVGGSSPGHETDLGLPLQTSPVKVSIETLGCPLWKMMQEIFIDFGTGTTVDNIYRVTSVTHKIEAGQYTTSVELVTGAVWGKYRSSMDQVASAIYGIAGIEH